MAEFTKRELATMHILSGIFAASDPIDMWDKAEDMAECAAHAADILMRKLGVEDEDDDSD